MLTYLIFWPLSFFKTRNVEKDKKKKVENDLMKIIIYFFLKKIGTNNQQQKYVYLGVFYLLYVLHFFFIKNMYIFHLCAFQTFLLLPLFPIGYMCMSYVYEGGGSPPRNKSWCGGPERPPRVIKPPEQKHVTITRTLP